MPTVVNIRNRATPFDLYIGRKHSSLRLKESFWKNPFIPTNEAHRSVILAKYLVSIMLSPKHISRLSELDGKVLGCFCKPKDCHGDLLVELREYQLSGMLFLLEEHAVLRKSGLKDGLVKRLIEKHSFIAGEYGRILSEE